MIGWGSVYERKKIRYCLWLMFTSQIELVKTGQNRIRFAKHDESWPGTLSLMYILDICVEGDNLMPSVLMSLTKEMMEIEKMAGGISVFRCCPIVEVPTQGNKVELSERYTTAPTVESTRTIFSRKGKFTSTEQEVGCVFTGHSEKSVWCEYNSSFYVLVHYF